MVFMVIVQEHFAIAKRFCQLVFLMHLEHLDSKHTVPDVKKFICPKSDRSMLMVLISELLCHMCLCITTQWQLFSPQRFTTMSLKFLASNLPENEGQNHFNQLLET